PFADSKATLAVAFGAGNYERPFLIRTREIKIGAISPIAEGQVNVWDGLAIEFGISGRIVSGLNTESAIGYGASSQYSLKIGALYEIIRSDSSVLSAGLRYSHPKTIAVSPLNAISGSLGDIVGSSDPDATTDTTTSRWTPNLRFAHSFAPAIGMAAIGAMR